MLETPLRVDLFIFIFYFMLLLITWKSKPSKSSRVFWLQFILSVQSCKIISYSMENLERKPETQVLSNRFI